MTGLVYGWMRYLLEPEDPFAVVNHPWQPDLQHLHVLAAPLLVFACGLIWVSHVWQRLRSNEHRKRPTGVAVAVLLIPMVASGYLLQITIDERWREVWTWTHGVSGSLWLAAYAAHQFFRRRANGVDLDALFRARPTESVASRSSDT